MVRSIAISAFTRVFDALWRCVSNHEERDIGAASSFETPAFALRATARSSG